MGGRDDRCIVGGTSQRSPADDTSRPLHERRHRLSLPRDRTGARARRGRHRPQGRAHLRPRAGRTRRERRRDLKRPDRRNDGGVSRRPRDRCQGQDRGSRLHRHASACRVLADHAARVRSLRARARRHHRDLRSARDRQRARRRGPALFPRRLDGDRYGPARAAFELRAGDASRDLWRAAGGRRSLSPGEPSQGARPRRIHEFPRRARPRSRMPRQARGVPGPAHRRAQPAAARTRSQRLSQRGHPHRSRSDQRPRGAGKARQGHADPGARRLGVQGLACACAHRHRAPFAVHRVLHRRSQSARHRRGRPSRLHHPHRDSAGRAAARRLSRGEHFGRADFRADGSRPRRAGMARRPRRPRRSRELRGRRR